MDNKDRQENRNEQENLSLKPDPGTTKTPDPQENMTGPVSTPMHNIGGAFDTSESKQHANEKRDKNM